MKTILCIVLLVVWTGVAFSQEKLGDQPKQKSARKENAKPEQRGTEQSPAFIKGEVTTKKTKEDAEDDTKDREQKTLIDKALVKYTGLSALFAFFLFIAASIQIGLFVWQLGLMRRGIDDAAGAANAAKTSADAAKESSTALMRSERAYVKMSHCQPGIKLESNWCQVTMEIKNHGRTPATVTDVFIGGRLLENGEPLPNPPPLPAALEGVQYNGFLVPQENFFVPKTLPLRKDMQDVKDFAKTLWVFGHIDYIDTFRQRHRSGYVRTYNPHVDDGQQNNLFFVTEGRYDYDRPRIQGEGRDWD